MLHLLADVGVQVAGKAEHVTHHLVGDHVAEEPAHVSQHARVSRQRGKHVMLEAGRERLNPGQSIGTRQDRGRDLSDEGVRAGHGRKGFRGKGGIDPLGVGRGRDERLESIGFDSRKDDDLHERSPGSGRVRRSPPPGGRWKVHREPPDARRSGQLHPGETAAGPA